ncbi:universal stress protein [Aquabacter sp. L1I39]|uniref:universal stress protein n=1 Tax=Aquabacter sp. L1I39 TaxID=2820278 RepID=UPI001ADBAF70|nr:universal stress protein [Aquabacter sp. L1I39]QTL01676.1 universal stress protein [Aquabacter sp. L1I39]
MIRDILVNLTQGADTDPAASFAVSLAKAHGAHLTGLAVTYEIDVPPFYMGAVPTDFIDAQMKENAEAAAKAAEDFRAVAQAAGVPCEIRTLSASLGLAANAFAEMSRLFDLTVVAQPDPDRPGPEEVIAETVLLDSGRAVLLVPYVQTAPYAAGRAVVAWDGSRAAARALNEALPLLHKAHQVEIFSVYRGNAPAQEDGADIVRHLARHNLSAQVRSLPLGSGVGVAEAILNEVADQGADLVVMGGYGHSPLRELVLGGVTREILSTMTVPVLMAH